MRLGPYEVTAQIGVGGMGEVYRATDTSLGRQVAIKVLPGALATDPDRLARFEREAKTLASLNHPNIAHIYGLERSAGTTYAIVMELVAGPTLAERLERGPIPVDEALAIARQIAEALEAAHDQGIIHRDLKPANIKVRDDGTVKVLDFGLATVVQSVAAPQGDVTHSPTLTVLGTQAGVILGTAAYMSPEQAAGKPVDKRADIWSFGVVLWEMLTGRRLFNGETVSHTLADVLRGEIDFAALPRDTPRSVRIMLRRCLDRDIKGRLRDIGEARVALQRYLTDSRDDRDSTGDREAPGQRSKLVYLTSAVAAISVVGAASLAFVHFREQPPVPPPIRFQIEAPPGTVFASGVSLSPDGRQAAFSAPGPDGRPLVWVRSLDALEARPLAGTEGASPGPFWAPDSRFVAFGVNGYPGRLKKVPIGGGPPQILCEYISGFREGAWTRDGVILFGVVNRGLFRVSEDGGTASPVTRVDASRQEIQHAGPAFLPDGRHFLYHRAGGVAEHDGIFVGAMDTPPEQQNLTRLLPADSDPVFVPSSHSRDGFVLFLRGRSLLAQGFDPDSRELKGEAIRIADDVGTTGSHGWFSASDTGVIAFRPSANTLFNIELRWVDRNGKTVGQIGRPGNNGNNGVQLSPDGKRVAVIRGDSSVFTGPLGAVQGAHAWIAELSRNVFSRVNSGEGTEGSPALSADEHVAFTSTIGGAVGDLYWATVNGVGGPEPLLVRSPTIKHPNGFSPDSRFLIFDDHHPTQRQDLWILPLEPGPGGERKPIPFLVTPADETFGQFSPDGRWIAYSSDESGRRDVYVQGFAPDRVPAAAVGKWQISAAGGDKPRWSRDGKELYYLTPDRQMMAVPVKIGATFEPGIAVPLFTTRTVGFFAYDVAADGRFLLPVPSVDERAVSSPVTVVFNWQSELKR